MKAPSKTNLFLLELLFMVLFFSVSAAICMRIFAFAQIHSNYGRDLSRASVQAQSAAEYYKAAGGDLSAVSGWLSGQTNGDGDLTVCYDKNWEPTGQAENAAFVLHMQEAEENRVAIEITETAGDSLFSLEVKAVQHES